MPWQALLMPESREPGEPWLYRGRLSFLVHIGKLMDGQQ